jgi:hypothetical protein
MNGRRARVGLRLALLGLALVLAYVALVYPALVSHGRRVAVPETRVAAGKVAVALLVLGGAYLGRRLVRAPSMSPRRVRLLRALGPGAAIVLGVVAYMNFGVTSGWPRYSHTWDVYHYYVGAKYARELGYTELYRCSVIAEAESSPMRGNTLRARRVRDLTTGGTEDVASIVAVPERCTSRFSSERWRAFRDDIAFFRARCDGDLWAAMLMDHGYQPPPAWSLVGGLVATAIPASDRGLLFLVSLDLALIAGAFALVYWAFGLRAVVTAVVFLGCQWPANGYFMTGTFLRHDWLFGSIAAVCLAARRRWLTAGALLGAAAALRVVPVFFIGGWALLVCVDLVRRRRAAFGGHVRFAAGLALSMSLLIGGSAALLGPSSHLEFQRSISRHAQTPIIEQMGLETILSYTREGRADRARNLFLPDQYQEWRVDRVEVRSRLRPVFVLCALGALVLAVASLRRTRATWAALVFGVLLATVIANVACYYYSFFILFSPLARLSRAYSAALIGLAAASAGLMCIPAVSRFWDDRYLAQSVLFLAFALGISVVRTVASRRPRTQESS